MKTILLMRHAKSSWEGKNQEDWERPLSKRGKKDAERIGELLKKEKLIPQLILASSAVRARETAELVMEEIKYRADYCSVYRLYLAEVDVYVREIHHIPDEVPMALIIGHSPSLDSLLQMVTGKVETLPTSAVAQLSIPIDSWKDFSFDVQGELVNLWRPKDL